MRLSIALLGLALAAVWPATGQAASATPTPKPDLKVNTDVRAVPGIVTGTPKPSVSSLTLFGQSPITLPSVQMSGSDSGGGSSGGGATHASTTTITFTLAVPAQSTQAGQLEVWCNTNKAFASAQLWMPQVSTLYKLSYVKIATYHENVSGSSGTVQFSLTFNGMIAEVQK
jgi:hypothetical protein